MSAQPPDERILLTSKSGTDIYIQYTKTPWLLDVDAFTIPVGSKAGLKGGMAQAFFEFIGGQFSILAEEIKESISRARGETKFSVSQPLSIPLPQGLSEVKASYLLIATAGDSRGFSPDLAKEAASAIVRASNRHSLTKVAISLLGSGAGGLSSKSVAESMYGGILDALPKVLPKINLIKEITLTTLSHPAIKTLKEMAKDFQEEEEEPSSPEKLSKAIGKLSPSAIIAIKYAWAFADEEGGRINFTNILAGILSVGKDKANNNEPNNSASFLCNYITQHSPKNEIDLDPISTLLGFNKELGTGFRIDPQTVKRIPLWDQFNLEGTLILIKSLEIAETTAPDSRIHLRSMIGAIFLAPPTIKAKAHLISPSYSLEDLQKDFLEFIKTQYPNDNQEAWEKILAGPRGESPEGEQTVPEPMPGLGGRAVSQKDEPAETDLLGHENLVHALAAMVADPNQGTPFTIGLLGEWGTGKSTVMNLIRQRLDEMASDRFIFAKFNAWEYERTKNLPAGLAQEVVQAFVDKFSWWDNLILRFEFALREHGIGALRVGFYVAVAVGVPLAIFNLLGFGSSSASFKEAIGLGAAGGLAGLGIYLWRSLKQIVEHPLSVKLRTYLKLPTYGEHLGLIPVLKRHIETICEIRLGDTGWQMEKRQAALGELAKASIVDKLFKKLTPKKKKDPKRLIVFIDDLDRCDPPSISSMLDAIRLVMDLEHVITIIGIDHRIAFRTVGDHYKDLEGGGRSKEQIARDYLGKIIQLPIMLHKPTETELKKYVKEALFPNSKSSGEDWKNTGEQTVAAETDLQKKNSLEKTQTQDSKAMEPITIIGNTDTLSLTDSAVIKLEKVEDPLKKEMVFTIEESERFGQLAHDFNLRNPRQLRRLRNTYGLLKLLFSLSKDPAIKGIKLPEENGNIHWYLMTLLFWKEFKFENSDLAKDILKKVSSGDKQKKLDEISNIASHSERVAGHLSYAGLIGVDSEGGKEIGLEKFVERFVLPQKIKRAVSDSEENAENAKPKAKKLKSKNKAKARNKK